MTADTPAGVLEQTLPSRAWLPPEAGEAALGALYDHPAGTVRLGMISSADGLAAGPDGSSRSLNGPADLRVLRTLRAACDVVLVGAGTARREGYGPIRLPAAMRALRGARGWPEVPALAVATASGVLPVGVAEAAAGRSPGSGEVLVLSSPGSAADMVEALRARGLTRVLCEGGPTVAAALLEGSLVSDYCLTTSPAAGGAGQPAVPAVPAGAVLAHQLEGDGFVMRRWLLA